MISLRPHTKVLDDMIGDNCLIAFVMVFPVVNCNVRLCLHLQTPLLFLIAINDSDYFCLFSRPRSVARACTSHSLQKLKFQHSFLPSYRSLTYNRSDLPLTKKTPLAYIFRQTIHRSILGTGSPELCLSINTNMLTPP